MKEKEINADANNLLVSKIIRIRRELDMLAPYPQEDLITFDIDPFITGRLVEKLDQCLSNIETIREEIGIINFEIDEGNIEDCWRPDYDYEEFSDQDTLDLIKKSKDPEFKAVAYDDLPF